MQPEAVDANDTAVIHEAVYVGLQTTYKCTLKIKGSQPIRRLRSILTRQDTYSSLYHLLSNRVIINRIGGVWSSASWVEKSSGKQEVATFQQTRLLTFDRGNNRYSKFYICP